MTDNKETEQALENLHDDLEKEGKKALNFYVIRPETKYGHCKLGENLLCLYFEPDPENTKQPYVGVAVKDSNVAAHLAHTFASFAQALNKQEKKGKPDIQIVKG